MYKVKYSKQAIKSLRKMLKNAASRIIGKINELALSPHSAAQVKLLKGLEGYRLRVGDWRIIYSIQEDEAPGIWIIKIAPRGEVYK